MKVAVVQSAPVAPTLTGAEELRAAVRLFDRCRESFLACFTAEELLRLARAARRAKWDFYPDQWTEAQIQIALRGGTPEWDAEGRPLGALTLTWPGT